MSDTPTPPATEKTIVVNSNHLCRLWTLTFISIGLNALILALLITCAILHHHHHKHHHGFGGRGGGGGYGGQYCMGGGGFGHGFHHHGGMGKRHGWGGQGGFGGNRQNGMGFRGGNVGGKGSMNMGRGPGMGGNGGPGMMGGGFGRGGMMGGGKGGPPDPAKMTDMMLNRLSTQLSLTDDEKAKIKPIILEQATQMQKDMEAQRVARQKAMADTKAKIKSLLTADQQKQLDALPLPGEKPPDDAKQPAPTPGT